LTFHPEGNYQTSGPAINGDGEDGISCPTATQCTAVDNRGDVVTFNPLGSASVNGTKIDKGNRLSAIACPTATQCTAIDATGQELTFKPVAPGTPALTPLDSGAALAALACPSASRCVAVGGQGEVTFDPASARHPTAVRIDVGPDVVGSQATATGFGQGHAALNLMLSAPLGRAPISKIQVTLPKKGIGFVRSPDELAKGVLVATPAGHQLNSTTAVRKGTLTITLAAPAPNVLLTLSRPAITVTRKLANSVGDLNTAELPIGVTAINTGGLRTRIMLEAGVIPPS
jgi:hypothetical protein